jgi:hypothetical protein
MSKKLKIGLLIVAFVLFSGFSFASAAALLFNNDTTITIGSANYTVAGGSSATSMTVGTSSLIVTVPDSAYFTLTSADRYVLSNDYGSAQCSASLNSLSIARSGTFTITPDTTATCTNNNGGGGGSGSSIVAGSFVPPVTVVPPVTPVTPVVPVVPVVTDAGCTGTNSFSTTTGQACTSANTLTTPTVAPALTSGLTGTYSLGTTTLKSGSKGDAVKELQRFLNDKLNLGLKLDGKLGPKTIAVIKKWQKANGLVPDGLIGAKTKAKINGLTQ